MFRRFTRVLIGLLAALCLPVVAGEWDAASEERKKSFDLYAAAVKAEDVGEKRRIYKELIERFGDSRDPHVVDGVIHAMQGLAALGDGGAELYDRMIALGRKCDTPLLSTYLSIAWAIVNKAYPLECGEKARLMDEILLNLGGNDEAEAKGYCALALMEKAECAEGVAETIALLDEAIALDDGADNETLQASVAAAMNRKAFILLEGEEKRDLLLSVIARFGASPSAEVREQVEWAKRHLGPLGKTQPKWAGPDDGQAQRAN
jgi:hypothetical protein